MVQPEPRGQRDIRADRQRGVERAERRQGGQQPGEHGRVQFGDGDAHLAGRVAGWPDGLKGDGGGDLTGDQRRLCVTLQGALRVPGDIGVDVADFAGRGGGALRHHQRGVLDVHVIQAAQRGDRVDAAIAAGGWGQPLDREGVVRRAHQVHPQSFDAERARAERAMQQGPGLDRCGDRLGGGSIAAGAQGVRGDQQIRSLPGQGHAIEREAGDETLAAQPGQGRDIQRALAEPPGQAAGRQHRQHDQSGRQPGQPPERSAVGPHGGLTRRGGQGRSTA